ncbi:solute carrier family 17 member 9-like [Anneissia japonica]|uniref:solute carrier family 17 member 9-like n=1 Tax=Anneissia japonica TaxID=1529436 RepID=UPI0014257CE0|nr:solute carrier family 17 member 9-like [Anneissia japonica]
MDFSQEFMCPVAVMIGVLLLLTGIAQLVIYFPSGFLVDCLIQREYLSALNTRKLCAILTLGVPATCLILLGYAGKSVYIVGGLLITIFGLYGIVSGILSNSMDLSPVYSGIISGIVLTVSSITGFAGPSFLGLLTQDDNVLGQWSLMFTITACLQILGMIIFLLFAQAEEQEWSKINCDKDVTSLLNY